MNKSIKIHTAVLASALVASTLILGNASAGEVPVSRSAKVSFVGLDLSTPAGVSAARERVHRAARKLCGAVSDELDLSEAANFVKCVDLAMGGSMPQLDALISKSKAVGMVATNRRE